MKKLLIITILTLTACASNNTKEAKEPCKPETTQEKPLNTAIAVYILSQGKGFIIPKEDVINE